MNYEEIGNLNVWNFIVLFVFLRSFYACMEQGKINLHFFPDLEVSFVQTEGLGRMKWNDNPSEQDIKPRSNTYTCI